MQVKMKKDAIAAIATPPGVSGIGIIRVSGSDAIDVVSRIFKSRKNKKLSDFASHTLHYGWIHDDGEILDEVLVAVMRAPHTYTTEDTVEIDCHGGILILRRILEAVIKYGASPAEPGEFTKRAFLNGRIDLSQAEAVMDVINSQNDYALRSSVSQLSGSLSKKIKNLRSEILYQLAYIESSLDDPEHISLEGYEKVLSEKIHSIICEVESLLNSADDGRVISEGVQTVILGKPNAGKSSLMNLMLGEERAIVTDIAGTTRDILEGQIRLHGINLNIIDTAGIRETQDAIEKIGVDKAYEKANIADLILFVVDGACPLDENDDAIIKLIQGKRVIVLLNKTDLDLAITKEELEVLTGFPVVMVSAKEETGISQFENLIQDMFYGGEIHFNDEVVITNVRHKAALSDALDSLRMVMKGISDQMPEDFLTIDLIDAYETLGSIIGESVEDDLVNEIFSKFCTGK